FDGRLADFNERKSPRTDVTIAFKPNVLAEVEEWLGVENVVKSKDGNGYWGFGSFPYDKMLVSKIMGFGSNVKVLRPAKLVSEIRKIAKNISELYSL
ncbi:MAG: WYL domain-containing protein, partial [Christensenellales bacterium]